MPFYIRKQIKIASGVRLNISNCGRCWCWSTRRNGNATSLFLITVLLATTLLSLFLRDESLLPAAPA